MSSFAEQKEVEETRTAFFYGESMATIGREHLKLMIL